MSRMHFWAPRPLFMWRLLWLLVQARLVPELVLDANLLTATTLGLTEPWPQDQEILTEEPSYAPGGVEFPSQQEVSALQTEDPEELEISPTPQENPAQQPEVPEEEEAFFTEEEPIEVPPKKGSTTPQVHFASAELSAGNEEGPAQPPETPKVTFLHPESIQAQQPTPPKIAVESVDLGVTVTPHPMEEAEQPTTLQQTTASPQRPEVTPSHREPAQAQQPTPPEIMVESVDLGVTITPHPMEEAEQPTTLQQTTASPEYPEVTPPHQESAQAQQSPAPQVTGQTVDLGLTITPQPTEEVEQPAALQQTTVSPEYPEVALSHVDSVQGPQPILPGDMEDTKSLQSEPSKLVPLTTEEKATMSVCELCTCRNETLSCVALGPKQRLRSVPVLQPSTDNDTFTTLDLQGNAISSLDKNTWESYQHIEKLILSGNEITELKKNSFKGLLYLKYLDLSCNKIQFIERNAFEFLPFLQHLNLSCNSLRTLSLGTFEAWHRMQFLYRIILSHNPLTTIEDPDLFKLPALKYLDLGTTQVSLKTVETIFIETLELEKLILPSRLSCCLCQFKDSIEAVSETIKLHCEIACVGNTLCDEELSTAKAALIDAVKSHRRSTELTIEPEKTSPEKSDNNLSTIVSEYLDFNDTELLMKLLKEEQKVEVPTEEWVIGQLGNESTNAQDEEEEQESSEMETELPSYLFDKKLIVAIPISVAATMFTLLLCLILICHRLAKGREGSSRGVLPIMEHNRSSPESEIEGGGFWSWWPLWLKDLYRPLTTIRKKNMAQRLHDESSDEDESLDKMVQNKLSEVRSRTSESGADDTGEERES